MKLFLLIPLVAACAGDPKESNTDASNVCTGQAYDACRDEHNCLDANCMPFGSLVVCTLACTAGGTACPMQDGVAVPCTNSVCQPTKANTCVLAP
jgi:hypothetical protein